MNSLTLRVTGGSSKKTKTSIGYSPVVVNAINRDLGAKSKILEEFNQASTSDEQLTILKTVFDEIDNAPDDESVKLLAIVFFQAECKHPVKCFITRQVTKRIDVKNTFASSLAEEIKTFITSEHASYQSYIDIATKVSACVENFPAGAAAVNNVQILLAKYFTSCLECCIDTLSQDTALSPTEKNEIFNLAHLASRLLLYIVQKVDCVNVANLTSLFETVRTFVQQLLYDEDVPMDTKSVCGILYLSMYLLENGPDSWINILQPKQSDTQLLNLLKEEASKLSLYSAITTVVSVDKLETQIQNSPAYLVLTQLLLEIGERSSSESAFILGVSRTLLQLCKMLDKITNQEVGLKMVDSLLVFIWSHLEHYMDSVRHLTAQMLNCVVRYCSQLKNQGNDRAISELFSSLLSLDKTRKSYYLSISSLTNELGALIIMERLPTVIPELLAALSMQAVQASATTALEILLQKHITECSTDKVHEQWIVPIMAYVTSNTVDSTVLNILESLLVKAVKWDENIMTCILPYIEQTDSGTLDVKCVLMLASVVRHAGAGAGAALGAELGAECDKWKGLVSYHVLNIAAVDAIDETRILSLSLVVESPKSTEVFTPGDLAFILYYLKYNINAQAPNFRQLTLSIMKKFMKRFEDSSKVLRRRQRRECPQCWQYAQFCEQLRALCFECVVRGANYSRRAAALQLLAWALHMPWPCVWKREYVDKLLLHLEDSYDNNKALALEILDQCPEELFKENTYTISTDFEDILQQASSLKPTDCTSAAYKFDFLRRKLPQNILQGSICSASEEPVMYTLLRRLLNKLSVEVEICKRNIVVGAREGPMYGVLHCMVHLMQYVDPEAICEDVSWTELVEEIIGKCVLVSASVACVVNNSSPEGHLPMDSGGVAVSDHGNSGGVVLSDGRPVTAQMVLLCAWRSVKEVSLLLGTISARLSIRTVSSEAGTLCAAQLLAMGRHFTTLLTETKHRGAFEQAYVGFTMLLDRLWRCRDARLHSLPRIWLAQLLDTITSHERSSLSATRRSAGVPFMIQALVTSEVQALGSSRCLYVCMTRLIYRCSPEFEKESTQREASTEEEEAEAEVWSRCSNVLRALARGAALLAAGAPHAQDALRAALHGFSRRSWTERNSSTLLFSALLVRVFGVTRSRDSDKLCVRNKMTGRIFFQRYPKLYDYMLEELQEVSRSDNEQSVHPTLYPILLLLARLYPSSLEGTVSNLKLAPFVPLVLACARSPVRSTRALAACAMAPLLAPQRYHAHVESMFKILHDTKIKRNYCHGILLQLTRLLDAKPDVNIDSNMADRLSSSIDGSVWVLEQAIGATPCYVIADEFVKVINLLVWKFPTIIKEETISKILTLLPRLVFNDKIPSITPGREVCLANALNLYLILLTKQHKVDSISEQVLKALEHDSYDVILTALNYILILNNDFEADNKLQEHLLEIRNENVLSNLKSNDKYIKLLCKIMKSIKYLECKQKCLKVLTIDGNTEQAIIDIDTENDFSTDKIVNKLFDCINNSHENLTHIYLESLSKFVTKHLESISLSLIIEVLRTVFACSTPDNKDENRSVVVGFLEKNAAQLMNLDLSSLSKADQFEYTATLFATLITTLEDDSDTLRQRTADTILAILGIKPRVIPSKCAEILADHMEGHHDSTALFVLVALLDFRSEVCLTDEINDECRVFDQNERYNIFLEETIWTSECAKKLIKMHNNDSKVIDKVLSTIDNPVYTSTYEKLCGNNIGFFKKMIEENEHKDDTINPKIRLFINMLS